MALAVLAGPMIVVAAFIRLRLGSPVLFRQVRPGLDGRKFRMIKFRTMTNAQDEQGALLADDCRLTPLGRMLRASSLDEIPELWNVLTGRMSLVGPRPLLLRYTRYFTANEARRLTVRPGITGWAQVNGRNTASWSERLAMDIWYVDNRNMILDLRILALTLGKVLKRDGVVVSPGTAMRDLDVERQDWRLK